MRVGDVSTFERTMAYMAQAANWVRRIREACGEER